MPPTSLLGSLGACCHPDDLPCAVVTESAETHPAVQWFVHGNSRPDCHAPETLSTTASYCLTMVG